jgi:hypothetical protein
MDSLFSELMISIMESDFILKSKMELREKLTMNRKNLQSLLTKQVTMKIS